MRPVSPLDAPPPVLPPPDDAVPELLPDEEDDDPSDIGALDVRVVGLCGSDADAVSRGRMRV